MMVLPECSFLGCRVERKALFKSPYSEKGRPAIYLGWGGGELGGKLLPLPYFTLCRGSLLGALRCPVPAKTSACVVCGG